MINGVIVIDKPKDFTSFDVVAVMRKLLHTKKIGHTGTLDPMATGVLPILVGNATKAQSLLPNTNKEYIASFKLGIKTDTQDITGEIITKCDFDVKTSDVKQALSSFYGDILQVPPMYSALKQDGKRLYDLARQGIEVERKPRKINISKIELLNFDETIGEGSFIVSCSKGTYIRTICEDLGKKLGTYAVMTDLRRTFACGFDLSNSLTIDKARDLEPKLENYILPVEKLFLNYKPICISEAQTIRFKNGGALSIDRLRLNSYTPKDEEIFRVFDPRQTFLGLGIISIEKEMLKVLKHF